jgi:hypothetical protein
MMSISQPTRMSATMLKIQMMLWLDWYHDDVVGGGGDDGGDAQDLMRLWCQRNTTAINRPTCQEQRCDQQVR